jgi:hypothetical protein
MTKSFVPGGVRIVALALLAGASAPAFALHLQTPFLEPIPFPAIQGAQSFRPFCQGQAARWQAFDSTSDLMHNGSSGDEIFFWDNDPAGPRHLVQVTNCAVGDSSKPADDANGQVIVFESTSNLGAPPATRCMQLLPSRRIFMAQQVNRAFAYQELTAGLDPAADCSNAVITSDGLRVAFQCAGDLRGNGSTGTNIYLWVNDQQCDPHASPQCSNVQQIPGTVGGTFVSANTSFNLLSTMLVFDSNAPIDGNANGFQQIWLYSITGNPPIGCPSEPGDSPGCPKPIRLTNGLGDSTHPSISQDARFVVFQSTADLLATGSTGSQIFLLDRTTGILTQLTQAAGDSTLPSISGNGRYIVFLSLGDFGFGVGGGPHLLLFDQTLNVLYQVTSGPGSAGNPIATADTIFFFDSDEDPTKTGITGRQIYALNVFLQVPKPAMGPATFRLMPGHVDTHGIASGGSSVRLITESTFGANPQTSYIIAPIGNQSTGPGSINLASLGINPVDQEGAVTVPKMTIPPIPVPSFGAVCVQQTAPGRGTIDCNGDANEAQPDVLDYRTFQDHVTNDEDPNCQFGCKEGSSCPGPLTPPPAPDCPRCVSEPGVCADGPLVGQACQFDTECPGKEKARDPVTGQIICTAADCGACNTTLPSLDERQLPHIGTCVGPGPRKGLWCDVDGDCPSDCLAQQTCHDGPTDTHTICASDRDCVAPGQCTGDVLDICQGPPVLTQTGSFGAGDMKVTIPVTARFSTNVGKDGLYCTPDDTYALAGSGFDAELRLTTGKAAATITDVDYTPGLTMGASEEGAPFSCDRWRSDKDLSGARLVGALTFLNVPFVPFTHDTIITFRFVADSVPCIPSAGTCSQPCTDDASCSDGDPCNGVEFCHLGNCQKGVPISCDDGNECNGAEVCDSANGGVCDKSAQQQCSQDNPCRVGTCRPDFLCVYSDVANGTACTDNNLCTGPDPTPGSGGGPCPAGLLCDACQDGVCTAPLNNVAANLGCEDNNVCHGIMACDPTTGNSCVQTVPPLVCNPPNPPNPCVDNRCDPVLGCNPPNTNPCSDGNACTGPDVCANGECHGDPTPASIACLATGTVCSPQSCDTVTGACVATPSNCDDGNPCTDDTCNPDAVNPDSACVHVNNTAACSDGNVCNGAETCQAGTCTAGTPLNCNDNNPCTTDTCDPVTGCQHTPITNGTACTDGNVCNGAEICQAGTCTAGTPLNCNDNNPCTTDTCDRATGCQHTPVTNGTACDDGNACTRADSCQGGACVGTNPIACAAEDECHAPGTCDPATGACTTPAQPDGTACDDGNACTQRDACQGGVCTGTPPVTCTALDQCHVAGICDPATGMCSQPAKRDGSACDDGDACTTEDTCQAGGCQPGPRVACILAPPGPVRAPGPAPVVTLNVERPPETTTTNAVVTVAGYARLPVGFMADALAAGRAAGSADLLFAVRSHGTPCSATAPLGTVRVTNCVIKTIKRHKSQVTVGLKLNKLVRKLLNEQGGLTLQVAGSVTEHHGASSPLAVFLKLSR